MGCSRAFTSQAEFRLGGTDPAASHGKSAAARGAPTRGLVQQPSTATIDIARHPQATMGSRRSSVRRSDARAMDPLRVLTSDCGFFTRQEAKSAGYADRDITRMVRSGAWIRFRHGAYAFSDEW